MKIIESWVDTNNIIYAIVQYTKKGQIFYAGSEFGVRGIIEDESESSEEPVGYAISEFETLENARDSLLKAIDLLYSNP